MAGAFASGADIFFAITFGNAIFEPVAVRGCDATVPLAVAAAFFVAIRAGFTLEAFLRAGSFRELAAALRGGDFFAGVLARLAVVANCSADFDFLPAGFDFFAFAIGYF
jgi:hypothetical protein